MGAHDQKIPKRQFIKSTAYAALGTSAIGRLAFAGKPPPIAKKRKKLRIVFYTDIHARVEWETPLALKQAAESINAENADLIFCGGDLITDGFQNTSKTVAPRWDIYLKNLHRKLKGDVFTVMGNHDLVAAIPEDGAEAAKNPRSEYLEKLGLEKTYQSFAACGMHFFILDSLEITGGDLKYRGFISDEQLEWLQGELAKIPKQKPIVLLTHVPLLSAFYQATNGSTTEAPTNRMVVNNREILALFSDWNLMLVLQGHLHVFEKIFWRKTQFITGGAICGKWWRGNWQGTGEGYCVMDFDGFKDPVVKYRCLDWKVRRP